VAATVIVTASVCEVVIDEGDGETVTVGVVLATGATVIEPAPDAEL
jgi:hypothetical protein